MKKLGKVFDTFRQSVNSSQRNEKVEETLQSDHFQLAKVCVTVSHHIKSMILK